MLRLVPDPTAKRRLVKDLMRRKPAGARAEMEAVAVADTPLLVPIVTVGAAV